MKHYTLFKHNASNILEVSHFVPSKKLYILAAFQIKYGSLLHDERRNNLFNE